MNGFRIGYDYGRIQGQWDVLDAMQHSDNIVCFTDHDGSTNCWNLQKITFRQHLDLANPPERFTSPQ